VSRLTERNHDGEIRVSLFENMDSIPETCEETASCRSLLRELIMESEGLNVFGGRTREVSSVEVVNEIDRLVRFFDIVLYRSDLSMSDK
jgi:hypothetical protein